MIHKAKFALRFLVALWVVLFCRAMGIPIAKPLARVPRTRVRATRPAQYDGQVNLTQQRAWFAVSTTTSLTGFFNSILEDALFVAREQNLMQNLVTRYVGTGLASRKLPIYPQLAATIVAEGTDFANAPEWTKSSQMELTPQIAMVQTIITESMVKTDPDNTRAAVAREQGGAIATKIDTDLLALFTSFSTGKGSANTTLTIANVAAAISVLRKNKVMNPIFAVLHPYGWHDLWTQLGQPAANQAFLGDVANLALRDFFVGQFLAAQFFTSANISIDGSADAVGAVFNREALALDMRQEADMKVDEDNSIAGFGFEINTQAWYGVAMRRATYGVKITHDATEPT